MKDNLNIKINCHSSICINDSIYIDPYNIHLPKHDAKLIFITHSHFDHFDIRSILNILTGDTVIICPKDVAVELANKDIRNQIVITYVGDEGEVMGVTYSTFPAYNSYHPIELGYVGYIISIDGIRYAICGDTDLNPELYDIKTDVLLVPIGDTYTMTPTDAATLANAIVPKLVVPVHYNFLEGTGNKSNEKKFLDMLDKDINYKILL